MFKGVKSFIQILGEDPRLKSIMRVVALFHSFLEITGIIREKVSSGRCCKNLQHYPKHLMAEDKLVLSRRKLGSIDSAFLQNQNK
jgi:hypothetical protein